MVCRPASSEMATKGMPRQTLAAMTEARALFRIAEEVDRAVDHAELHQRPGDDRELRIVDPPEGQRREHGRNHPGQEHDRPEEGLERQVLIQQQRQPEPEDEFQDRGDDRVEKRVEDREPEHRVLGQEDVVLEPDEHPVAADARVGEAEPDAETERIGQEADKEDGGRQHEEEAEHVPVLHERGHRGWRLPG